MLRIAGITFFIFTSLGALGQVLDNVEKGIGAGDVSVIVKYLDDRISLSVDEDTKFLTKTQVQSRLTNFFGSNKPSSYSRKHDGQDKNGTSKYTIGQLQTNNGKFRVYVYVEQSENKQNYLVRELRFESM